MKKIYLQKNWFIFMNVVSLSIAIFAIVGGIKIDKSIFYLLFMSLFFSSLSILFLINKLYYNENIIKFKCVLLKKTLAFNDIKEIYVQANLLSAKVVFNLERETDFVCKSFWAYCKKCREEGINDTVYMDTMPRKNLKALLKNYNGKIQFH